ncbi:unnamed protein product [Menidia menidia]|uniref:(Atlantic silverside) hypothetical protein n=1 Tax=Menidia menidia TaxID=238744 RepID=A0A8S4BLV9_9TELE|nr:unnamed protein product [Menidia menidia]
MLDGLRRRHASRASPRPLSLNFSTFSAPPPSPDMEGTSDHPIRRFGSASAFVMGLRLQVLHTNWHSVRKQNARVAIDVIYIPKGKEDDFLPLSRRYGRECSNRSGPAGPGPAAPLASVLRIDICLRSKGRIVPAERQRRRAAVPPAARGLLFPARSGIWGRAEACLASGLRPSCS